MVEMEKNPAETVSGFKNAPQAKLGAVERWKADGELYRAV